MPADAEAFRDVALRANAGMHPEVSAVMVERSSMGGLMRAFSDPRLSQSPLSSAVSAGGFIFISGQVGRRPTDGWLAEDFQGQFQQAIANLELALELANSRLDAVVQTTVYLVDRSDFALMNELYGASFSVPRPARTTVVVAGLTRQELLFEINAIAVAVNSDGP